MFSKETEMFLTLPSMPDIAPFEHVKNLKYAFSSNTDDQRAGRRSNVALRLYN